MYGLKKTEICAVMAKVIFGDMYNFVRYSLCEKFELCVIQRATASATGQWSLSNVSIERRIFAV